MKHEVLELKTIDFLGRTSRFMHEVARPFMRGNPFLAAALVFSLLSSVYWLFIASDRYVSEAHVIVQKTEIGGGAEASLTSLLTGSSTGNRSDQLILRDYLRSTDIVRKLDQELKLSEHYSAWGIDPFSRMTSDPTIEELHSYYLSRVSIEYDEYTGVLIIKVQGFDPDTAYRINQALVREGEAFMNSMAHGLAENQVTFLEKQVAILGDKAMKARGEVLNYQNRNGLVSPEAATEALSGIVSRLEAQRTELQTQLAVRQAYLVDDHPRLVELQQQIDAIGDQIDEENAKMASPQGNKLNSKIEEFQRLQLQAEFAQNMYKSALIALEQGRVEGTRMIKKMSIVQTPLKPDSAQKPERLYEAFLYTIMAMLFAGVAHLLMAIVKDHRD